jgi:hypothetical protein
MSTNPVSCIPGENRADPDRGASTVGKPKKDAKKAEPMKPKTIGVRATGEWAAWVDELADHCRIDVAKLIDTALVELAERRNFGKKPPRRIP